MRRGLIYTALLACMWAGPVLGQDAADLRQVESEISAQQVKQKSLAQERQRLAKEAKDARQRLVKAAKELQAMEEELRQVQESINQTLAEEQEQTRLLLTDRKKLSDLLVTLQRLSKVPPETILASQSDPGDMMRSTVLLRAAVPELRHRAAELAQALERLASLREGLAAQHAVSVETKKGLKQKWAQLDTLLKERQKQLDLSDAQKVALDKNILDLRAKATSLRDLMVKVEAQKLQTFLPSVKPGQAELVTTDPLVLNRRTFRYPATGPVAAAFGSTGRTGEKSRGVRIKALPGAVVVAPLDGLVRFAGTFKNYGRILIIQHADAYHSLIAGLGDIDVNTGQRVGAGEPLGTMPGAADSDGLYYELRRQGDPVDPKSFLTYGGRGRQ